MTEQILHLGCGKDIHSDAHNVDRVSLPGVDQTCNLNQYPWDLPKDHFVEIRAYHVFEHLESIQHALRECGTLLVDGGRLEVKLPVGQNAVADPDHKHEWIWDTPLYYCGNRHWDTDVGLVVESRSVELETHLNGVAKRLVESLIWGYKSLHGSGRWLFDVPFTSGEFTVVFKKP